MRPWQRRAGFQSQTAGGLAFLHSFSSIWNCSFSHSLSISCPFSSLTPNTLSHETILHSSLFLLGCQGSHLSSLISHEGPSYSAPSFVHVHMASLSFCGVRSVHEALCWTLMLIISNPHSKMHSKYWPHFTTKETESEWGHITGQMLNRRAGIWTSSCQFRAFFSFTSCHPDGDWGIFEMKTTQ